MRYYLFIVESDYGHLKIKLANQPESTTVGLRARFIATFGILLQTSGRIDFDKTGFTVLQLFRFSLGSVWINAISTPLFRSTTFVCTQIFFSSCFSIFQIQISRLFEFFKMLISRT